MDEHQPVAAGPVRPLHHVREDVDLIAIGALCIRPDQGHRVVLRPGDLERILQVLFADALVKHQDQIAVFLVIADHYFDALAASGISEAVQGAAAAHRIRVQQGHRGVGGDVQLGGPVPLRQAAPELEVPAPVDILSRVLRHVGQDDPDPHVAAQEGAGARQADLEIQVLKGASQRGVKITAPLNQRLAHDGDVHAHAQQVPAAHQGPAVRELEFGTGTGVAVGPHVEVVSVHAAKDACGGAAVKHQEVQTIAGQIHLQPDLAVGGEALVGIALILHLVAAQVHADAAAEEAEVGARKLKAFHREFILAGSQDDARTLRLQDLHDLGVHRTPELQGRDGVPVAVDGVHQAVEARAAAGEADHRDRRHQGDAPKLLAGHIKVEVVGHQLAAVGPLELQLAISLQQVEDVDVGLKVIGVRGGVDGAVHVAQLDAQQADAGKFAIGLHTVHRENPILEGVAEFGHFQRLLAEHVVEGQLSFEGEAAVSVCRAAGDGGGGAGQVHAEHGVVAAHVRHLYAAAAEAELQRALRTRSGLIELEAGGVQVDAALLHGTVGPDAEVAAVAPGGGHCGGEGRRAAGEVVGAVFQFKVAPDHRHGITGDAGAALAGRDGAVGVDGQPVGVGGDGDLIGVGGDWIFLRIDQIPVSDEKVGSAGVVRFMKICFGFHH